MSWEIILSSAITSTIVSGLATMFLYNRQKRTDFDYDYRKYILDKRIKAYESIEQLLNYDLSGVGQDSLNHFFEKSAVTNTNIYEDFVTKIGKAEQHNFWLTKSASTHLYEFKKLNQKIGGYNNEKKPTRIDALSINVEFLEHTKNLHIDFLDDIIWLNDISLFNKQKREVIAGFKNLDSDIEVSKQKIIDLKKMFVEVKKKIEYLEKSINDKQKT